MDISRSGKVTELLPVIEERSTLVCSARNFNEPRHWTCHGNICIRRDPMSRGRDAVKDGHMARQRDRGITLRAVIVLDPRLHNEFKVGQLAVAIASGRTP